MRYALIFLSQYWADITHQRGHLAPAGEFQDPCPEESLETRDRDAWPVIYPDYSS